MDDEYFVRMLSMRRDIVDTPSAVAAREAALRALHKATKRGFTQALIQTIKQVEDYTPSGIYLGKTLSYDVDLRRLTKVIERTTRGLYFQEFEMRLPDDHWCQSYALDGFAFAGPTIQAEALKLWNHAISGKRRDYGREVFSYWCQMIDGPERATLWGFLVYGGVIFLSMTGPSESFRTSS